MLNIAAFTFVIYDAYKSLKGLTRALQVELLYETEELERQKIRNVIKEIEKTHALTVKGFFEITRSTLTGMVSVGITYVIILVQFKMSVK